MAWIYPQLSVKQYLTMYPTSSENTTKKVGKTIRQCAWETDPSGQFFEYSTQILHLEPNFLTAFFGEKVSKAQLLYQKKQSKSWALGAIVECNFQKIDSRFYWCKIGVVISPLARNKLNSFLKLYFMLSSLTSLKYALFFLKVALFCLESSRE